VAVLPLCSHGHGGCRHMLLMQERQSLRPLHPPPCVRGANPSTRLAIRRPVEPLLGTWKNLDTVSARQQIEVSAEVSAVAVEEAIVLSWLVTVISALHDRAHTLQERLSLQGARASSNPPRRLRRTAPAKR